MKVTINDKEYYFDGFLKKNLDVAKEIIKKDWDMIFIVDGIEGSGKSVLAQQMGGYLDPTLCIERITFNPSDFEKQIRKAQKYECIIYDEAYGGLASRQSMSYVNQSLIKMLTEIRQKNLFVFIVLPCYFELDKYPAIFRSRALIHIYTGANFQRGYFSFFSSNKKKDLYMKGKKFYEYKVRPNFRGRFLKGYFVNEKEYRAKKLKVLSNPEVVKEVRYKLQRDSIVKFMAEDGYTQVQISKAVSKYSKTRMDRSSISKIIKALNDK